jgi:hypothetical protein
LLEGVNVEAEIDVTESGPIQTRSVLDAITLSEVGRFLIEPNESGRDAVSLEWELLGRDDKIASA